MEGQPNRYPKCAHIPKPQFENEANEEITKSLGESFRLLPLFESGIFEHTFIDHNSVTRNPLLRCRWLEYKTRRVEGVRRSAPFELPNVKDTLHFYNGAIRFVPSASTKHQDHRRKLKPGPGVDLLGQMPIPQEAIMKRGATVKNTKRGKQSGNEKEKAKKKG